MQPSLGKVNLPFSTMSWRQPVLIFITLGVDGTLIHGLLEQLTLFIKS